MPERHPDRLTTRSVLSHLGVIVAVSALMGLLIAGLAIPFAAITGGATRSVADGIENLPTDLTAVPLAQRTRVVASDGSLLATWYDQNRVNVRLDQVAPIMREAILSIEDYRFYEHGALDLKGTVRAFVTNQASSGVVQGGSSITQQMVKQTLVNQANTPEEVAAATADTYERKWDELKYAIAFEEKYSKDWILERYLNIAYFGDGAYGVEAAARHYFSKHASQLSLPQAATLAGLVQNPSRYDPTNDPEAAQERRNVVLGRMGELNVISPTDEQQAMDEGLGLKISNRGNGCVGVNGEFFCDYLREYLLADPSLGKTVAERRHLLNTGGLTIETTLDPRMQVAADASMHKHVFPTDKAIGGLAMVVPGTGEVRALSQSRPMGRNKAKGQSFLNYVVPAKYGDSGGFGAGSTFKLFVLAAAIKQGLPLSTSFYSPPRITMRPSQYTSCNGPYLGVPWTVNNSTSSGRMNMYTGTQKSVNTYFAQLEAKTGLCDPISIARELGVTVPERDEVPPFTLGVTDVDPLTMAAAYATFPARGVYCEPRPVSRILGTGGKVLAEYHNKCQQVLPAPVGDAINDILRGVQEPGGFGYSARINLKQPSAGKTGTVSDNKSVWFVGYTPDLATASMLAGANALGHKISLNNSYVGGQFIGSAHGSTEAGPIWGDAMKAIQKLLPDNDFVAPAPSAISGRLARVPKVAGMDPAAAATALREAGFVPSVGSYAPSQQPQGTVAFTLPQAGARLGTGTPVTLYISNQSG